MFCDQYVYSIIPTHSLEISRNNLNYFIHGSSVLSRDFWHSATYFLCIGSIILHPSLLFQAVLGHESHLACLGVYRLVRLEVLSGYPTENVRILIT